MSISFRSEARGLQRLPYLKYYNVSKRESRFNWRLNSAEIIDHLYQKIFLAVLIAEMKWKSRFNWRLNSAKIIDYLYQKMRQTKTDIIRVFGSVDPGSEFTFPLILNVAIFGAP